MTTKQMMLFVLADASFGKDINPAISLTIAEEIGRHFYKEYLAGLHKDWKNGIKTAEDILDILKKGLVAIGGCHSLAVAEMIKQVTC